MCAMIPCRRSSVFLNLGRCTLVAPLHQPTTLCSESFSRSLTNQPFCFQVALAHCSSARRIRNCVSNKQLSLYTPVPLSSPRSLPSATVLSLCFRPQWPQRTPLHLQKKLRWSASCPRTLLLCPRLKNNKSEIYITRMCGVNARRR